MKSPVEVNHVPAGVVMTVGPALCAIKQTKGSATIVLPVRRSPLHKRVAEGPAAPCG